MKKVSSNKRIILFSFYDKDGIVDRCVEFTLRELKTIAKRIIIVVNGNVGEEGVSLFAKYSKEILIRENKGYDAGGFTYILNNYLQDEDWSNWDELVLCNDTFFGPFTPMKKIFEEMDSKECELWGLNGYFDVIFPHIQSYFLVFRKRIIEEKQVLKYFQENIRENTLNINDVYCQFETGLFDYLVRECGYKYSVYCKPCYLDVYGESYHYLKKYHLPIVKKKAFNIHDSKNWLCTLSYIKYETDYDIDYILPVINRKYNLRINKENIKPIDCYCVPVEKGIARNKSTDAYITFETSRWKFYIYGIGMVGYKAYWRYAKGNPNFVGFIISDDYAIPLERPFNQEVFHFKDIMPLGKNEKVVLGVGSELTPEILNKFEDKTKVIRIY